MSPNLNNSVKLISISGFFKLNHKNVALFGIVLPLKA